MKASEPQRLHGLPFLSSFPSLGYVCFGMEGVAFIIIRAAVGTYYIYQNAGTWPKAKTETHTSGQRVFQPF